MTKTYNPSERQLEANRLMGGRATHTLLYGGSRSSKTFLICRANLIRAGRVANSTHAIMREHFNHLKHSIIFDTMPTVQKLCFPGLKMHLDRSDWFHLLPNGSKIIYGGLDDNERTEKILGQEHSTMTFNECSQISYGARNKGITRLAQNSGLKLRAFYDCNPPPKSHWTYQLFVKKVEPSSRMPLESPDNYVSFRLNPIDNLQNLPDTVIENLKALPAKDQQRFLYGEFADNVDNALWRIDDFKRVHPADTEKQIEALRDRCNRIVVSIDPSGCTGPEDDRSDLVGLTVNGLEGTRDNGTGYVLEDASGRYSPEQWGKKAVELFDKWQADTIVGEINYGGDMVRAVVHAARPNVPFKKITASRGKHVRAEPVSALYAKGRVYHAGILVDLEDQLCNFSTSGYEGERSPDRSDASIFGLTELMLDTSSGQIRVLW